MIFLMFSLLRMLDLKETDSDEKGNGLGQKMDTKVTFKNPVIYKYNPFE